MQQRHFRDRYGAWVRARGAFRWYTIHNCTDRAHEFRWQASLGCKAFSVADVLLVSEEFHSGSGERGGAWRVSMGLAGISV